MPCSNTKKCYSPSVTKKHIHVNLPIHRRHGHHTQVSTAAQSSHENQVAMGQAIKKVNQFDARACCQFIGRAQDTLDGAKSQEEQVQWGRKKLETKKICEVK